MVVISVLHPSRSLRARNLRKSPHSLVCFLSCLPGTCFLAWIELFLPLRFFIFDFFDFHFDFDFSISSCFFHPAVFLLGSMRSSRFLWRLVMRTACTWYVLARTSLFIFVWGVDVCFSYHVYYSLLSFLWFFTEVFFHSRVIGACPATTDIHCIVAMSKCEHNNIVHY